MPVTSLITSDVKKFTERAADAAFYRHFYSSLVTVLKFKIILWKLKISITKPL